MITPKAMATAAEIVERARQYRDEAIAQLESVGTVDRASMERLTDVVRGVISA